MKNKITELPVEWDTVEPDLILETGSISYLKFLGRKLFQEYEPMQFDIFESRLIKWLNNVDSDRERKILIRLLVELFFIGRNEYEALYRSVYGSVFAPWIIDTCQIDPFSKDIDETIASKLNATWICPITDSLRVNSLLKVSDLQSMEHRPDWKSLVQFSDIEKVRQYIKSKKIRRIILLEDFVGSGSQVGPVVGFAGRNFQDIDILICPLVICPKGDKLITEIADQFDNMTYRPGLLVPKTEMFSAKKSGDEKEHAVLARELFKSVKSRCSAESLDAMYGFKGTGAQIVMYSNCPNNTLRIYHHDSEHWVSLFPRVRRV